MIEREVTVVAGPTVRCTGSDGDGHAALVITTSTGRVSECPVCGRRFRRQGPSVDPAVWPREE